MHCQCLWDGIDTVYHTHEDDLTVPKEANPILFMQFFYDLQVTRTTDGKIRAPREY
jgi:hypothetical protein